MLSGPDPLQVLLDEHVEADRPIRWDPIPWGLRAEPTALRRDLEGFSSDPSCDLPGDLLFVDCAEPPCFGIYQAHDPNHGFDPNGCPAWMGRFGGVVNFLRVVVPCQSGSVELFLVTPYDAIAEHLPEAFTPDDVSARKIPRFHESLDLEAVCRSQPPATR